MLSGLVIVTEHRTAHNFPHALDPKSQQTTRSFLNGRERRESDGPIVVISQPDLSRELWLDKSTRTFTVRPLEVVRAGDYLHQRHGSRFTTRHNTSATSPQKAHEITVDVTQTEESAVLFGYNATRYITRRMETYHDDGAKTNDSISDGWYIEVLHPAMPPTSRRTPVSVSYVAMENSRPLIKRTGEREYVGIPARVRTTTRQRFPDPAELTECASTQTVTIVALLESTLDPMLFDIPRHYLERTNPKGFRHLLRSSLTKAGSRFWL